MSWAVSRRRRNVQQLSKPWGYFLWLWGLSLRSIYLVCWTSSEQPCRLRTLPTSKHLYYDFTFHPIWLGRRDAPSQFPWNLIKPVLCIVNFQEGYSRSYKEVLHQLRSSLFQMKWHICNMWGGWIPFEHVRCCFSIIVYWQFPCLLFSLAFKGLILAWGYPCTGTQGT